MKSASAQTLLSAILLMSIPMFLSGCSTDNKLVDAASAVDVMGDINCNGTPNEIADAVMFTNYFINGEAAFGEHVEASRHNSDANRNGLILELADMVYIVRILTGDANPYPMPLPEDHILITLNCIGGLGYVSYQSVVNLGAIFLDFNFTGGLGTPGLGDGAVSMDTKYGINGNELRILIYNIGTADMPAGENDLVTIPYTGDINMIGAEAATYHGFNIDVSIKVTPLQYDLSQNYPNPFSSSTTIVLSLPLAADWQLVIKNTEGDIIREYSGYSQAGEVIITWDATDNQGNPVLPGTYFYTATIDDYSTTKTMVYAP